MNTVTINNDNAFKSLRSIHKKIGGEIRKNKTEQVLIINNQNAKGQIKASIYDRGLSLIEYDIVFRDDVELMIDIDESSPLFMFYFAQGHGFHRADVDDEPQEIEQYRSVITSSSSGSTMCLNFPANKKLEFNEVQIDRRSFLAKKVFNMDSITGGLYEAFTDNEGMQDFVFYGAFDLKLCDAVAELKEEADNAVVTALKKEGIVYQIISDHLRLYTAASTDNVFDTSLLKRELKTIKELSVKISKDVSKDYCLDTLSEETGLPQAKLQEGFKLLYGKTVTEYIRHLRLEVARDLMNDSDLNISEIVYTIGFSSRSYFSKIFKEKYNISPNEYKSKVFQPVARINRNTSRSLEVVA